MSRKDRSPVQLIEVLTRLAEQRVLWEPLIKFDPVSRHYARLAAERGFEPSRRAATHRSRHSGAAGGSATAVRHQAHPQSDQQRMGTRSQRLHVYAPALVEMNGYEVVDGDSLRLTESQLVGRNW